MERRAHGLELKAVSDDSGRFSGRAAVYGNRDDGRRHPARGVHRNAGETGCDAASAVVAFAGRTIGNRNATDGNDALYVDGILNLDVARARETYSLLKGGSVSGISIGYLVPPSGSETRGDTRYLNEIDLLETSLVAIPANGMAQVTAVKSIGSVRDFERYLHQAGWSKSEARRLASHGWGGLQVQDDDVERDVLEWLRSQNTTY